MDFKNDNKKIEIDRYKKITPKMGRIRNKMKIDVAIT